MSSKNGRTGNTLYLMMKMKYCMSIYIHKFLINHSNIVTILELHIHDLNYEMSSHDHDHNSAQ